MTAEDFASGVAISGGNVQGLIYENHGTVTQNFIYQVSEVLGGQAASSTEQFSTHMQYRQRAVLLSKVKEYWIEGVLNKSLHIGAIIELGMEKRVNAVEGPFRDFEELSEKSRQILPPGTSATEFFNQMGAGRTLLILGEPGSGKTITLLKLAQNLIARTEAGLSRLTPVVLSLSSWGTKKQTIANWLIEELYSKYQVSKKLGKTLIEEQHLLLLLDGLDEVKAECREACVQAINQFVQEHGQTEMVVCSRITDYEILFNRLQLRGAIFIRSLTPEQINQYLDGSDKQLQAVKALLQEDPVCQELAKSPLTLSVMTLAYQGTQVEECRQTSSLEERRQDLFDAYIKQMFKQERIGKSSKYNPPYQNEQTKLWLTWLAQRMSQTSQTIFLIEEMQPTWLPSKAQRIIYQICSGLIGGLIVGLVASLIDTLIQWLIMGSVFHEVSKFTSLLNMFIGGLISAGLVVGLIIGLGMAKIQTIQTIKWSWGETRRSLPNGLIFGLALGLFVGLINTLKNPSFGLLVGLMTGMIGGFIYCATQGLKGSTIKTTVFPNEGIWQSARSAVFLGLIGGVSGAVIGGSIMGIGGFLHIVPLLDSSISKTAIRGLSFGLINGIVLGAVLGGIGAFVKHFVLRFILCCNNSIPWNYARFLNYATERIFLQKVGGGYIFVHRLLLEHFVRMK